MATLVERYVRVGHGAILGNPFTSSEDLTDNFLEHIVDRFINEYSTPAALSHPRASIRRGRTPSGPLGYLQTVAHWALTLR
jgi:hypothetical protein